MTEQKPKICAMCGEPLPANSGNNRKYCSPKCARESEKNARLSVISKKAKARSKYAFGIICAFEGKCAICGWQASPCLIKTGKTIHWSYGNEIHHIKPVADGGTNDHDNMILLCPNHHKMAHMGLIDEQDLRRLTRQPVPFEKTAMGAQLRMSEQTFRRYVLRSFEDKEKETDDQSEGKK